MTSIATALHDFDDFDDLDDLDDLVRQGVAFPQVKDRRGARRSRARVYDVAWVKNVVV